MHPFLDPNCIPDYLRKQLDAYASKGVPLGDFLIAVVSNDLVRIVERADPVNMRAVAAYANYLYNHMPSICYGSKEVYFAWVNYHKLVRAHAGFVDQPATEESLASEAAIEKAVELVNTCKAEAERRRP